MRLLTVQEVGDDEETDRLYTGSAPQALPELRRVRGTDRRPYDAGRCAHGLLRDQSLAACAAFSISAATSLGCTRNIAWLPRSSIVCDFARLLMNRSSSGL